jgi:hypothetical protein
MNDLITGGVFDAWSEAVSPDYFAIVGARTSAGRFFSESDDAVTVIGEEPFTEDAPAKTGRQAARDWEPRVFARRVG